MYILPLVEIRKGESVHVMDGPGQGETRPLLDPAEVVQRFQGLGAQGFHVVDVDHALDPSLTNDETLVSILDTTVLPVQAGGGVRSLKRIQELLDTGARRVLVGSMGVLHPEWLKEASLIFQERLVACLDVRGEELLVKGRTETAPTSLRSFLERVDGWGLESLHITYLGANGAGPDLAAELATSLRTKVSYQGPIAGTGDLERLERAGVHGVVLGPEIYDGRLPFQNLAKVYRVR